MKIKDIKIWSAQSERIFSWFKHPDSNALTRARAGTGKTTNLVKGATFLPRGIKARALAYNTHAASELKFKISENKYGRGGDFKASSAYGFGSACLRNMCKSAHLEFTFEENRAKRILAQHYGSMTDKNADYAREMLLDPRTQGRLLALVAKLKQYAPLILFKGDVARTAEIGRLATLFDLCPDRLWPQKFADEALLLEWWVRQATAILQASTTFDGTHDYSDMVWLPLQLQRTIPYTYDVVLVDEAQDWDMGMIELAVEAAGTDGKIMLFGDERQALYAFRGGDTQSLDRLKTRLNATEFPLTETRRCPKSVVDRVQHWVPDLTAMLDAPVGAVHDRVGWSAMLQELRPGDYCLARINAPLFGIALQLLKRKVPVRITGRKEFGEPLLKFMESFKVHKVTDLRDSIHDWLRKRREAILGNPALTQADVIDAFQIAADKAGSALEILAASDTSNATAAIDALRKLLVDSEREDGKPVDQSHYVTCSTVHRIKGGEADRVFVLMRTFFLAKGDPQEEENIAYVAFTRSKRELFVVDGPPRDWAELG